MDAGNFDARVRAALEDARDALARIEMEVRESGESGGLLEASRLYARFCLHAREYLTGVQQRRAFPRRFAERVDSLRAELIAHRAATDRLGARPSPEELGELARAARELPDRY